MSEQPNPGVGIALFLKENMIGIDCFGRDGMEVIKYTQHTSSRDVELGETVYDLGTGRTEGVSGDIGLQRHRLEGFVTNVTRPIARLLLQTEGKFYEDERWNPVHDALDYVEGR